jgi:cytochrome P450
MLLSPAPSSTSLPPGPRHASWWQTARLVNDAEGFLSSCVARYGDPFSAPIRDGMVVFTGRRDLVKAIFSAPTDVVAPYAPDHIASVLGPHALILLTGGRHKHERSMVMPLFHGQHLHTWTQTMVEVTRAHLAALPTGDVVALDLCQRIALDVVLRVIFGFADEARHRQILDLTLAFLGAVHPLAIFFDGATKQLPDAMKVGRLKRWPVAKARLAAFLQDEITRRRRPGHMPGPTVIDTFLQLRFDDGSMLSDDDVADQLRTFLVTGHETTAGAMAWAIDAVFRDPAIHDRLQDELATVDVDDGEALARLPYLGAVVDEALRLHPVIPYVPKRTVQPFELDGHQLPIGTGVFVTAALAHMNPEVFSDPTRFRPERFLEEKPAATEYFPFGGGVKRCLASAFATHEMRIVLGTIVARHRFAPRTGPLRPVHHGISRGPAGRGPLTNLGPLASASTSSASSSSSSSAAA